MTYRDIYKPQIMGGTHGADELFATKSAADALYEYSGSIWEGPDYIEIWDRTVRSYNGDDLIFRDRPGDYKADGFIGGLRTNPVSDGADVTLSGNVLISGGNGNDTVSYTLYSGGIDIDLKPVAQDTWNEPWFWNGHADVAGTAKANGLSGQSIHGFDYLIGIENAAGTNYGDKIKGTDDSNKLWGHDGQDQIWGRGGHDFLYGGDDRDHVYGGDGNDAIDGGEGNDVLKGENGNDNILGGSGHDTIEGGDGNDIIAAGSGNDTVRGGANNDLIFGGEGFNKLYGDGGDDDIYIQGSGNAYGGDGADEIWGSNTNNYISAGDHFNDGFDVVRAGGGNDKIVAGYRDDVDGGAGRDTIQLNLSSNLGVEVRLDALGNGTFQARAFGNEIGILKSIENVITGSANDHLEFTGDADNDIDAGHGNNTVYAGGGNDTIRTRNGNDHVEGGSGDDAIRTDGGDDFVTGGWGDDYIRGFNGEDDLRGDQGEDIVRGGGDDDKIRGGKDADILTGGSGRDGFIYDQGDYGLDTITDFVIGEDWIGIQDFLKNPVPAGGSYAGKVVASQTWDGDDVVLTAQTSGGWQSFARLENHDVSDVWAAIQSGELFDGGTAGGDGPGGYVPDAPHADGHFGELDWTMTTHFDEYVFAA